MGRQAKGVRLIRLDNGRKLASIVAFESETNDKQPGSPSGLPPTEDDGSGDAGEGFDDSSSDVQSFSAPTQEELSMVSQVEYEEDSIEESGALGSSSAQTQAAFDEMMEEEALQVKGPDDFQTMIF